MFIFIGNYLINMYGKFQFSETSEKKVIKKVYDLLGQPSYMLTMFKILRDLLFGNLTCKYKMVAMETDTKVCAVHNFTPSKCSFGKELF